MLEEKVGGCTGEKVDSSLLRDTVTQRTCWRRSKMLDFVYRHGNREAVITVRISYCRCYDSREICLGNTLASDWRSRCTTFQRSFLRLCSVRYMPLTSVYDSTKIFRSLIYLTIITASTVSLVTQWVNKMLSRVICLFTWTMSNTGCHTLIEP